ncbi:MAG: DUF4364 family protein [Lachnospiraceae bacterium]|nr:DUF4364 family protein [Lachnospiraceae bacterium]
MNDSLLVYKLTIMYMLEHSGSKITKAMICDFMLGGGYVSYFSLIRSLSELRSSGFINEENACNRTLVSLTDEGRETLSYFSGMLSGNIRGDVDRYLSGKLPEMKQELSLTANYIKDAAGYKAVLKTEERGNEIINITISVPDEETAEHVCAGWKDYSAGIYEYITGVLIK